MIKILTVLVLGLLLVGCVSGYICVDFEKDNEGVLEFKQKINLLALKADIETHNLTEQALYTKLKYFNPCK